MKPSHISFVFFIINSSFINGSVYEIDFPALKFSNPDESDKAYFITLLLQNNVKK